MSLSKQIQKHRLLRNTVLMISLLMLLFGKLSDPVCAIVGLVLVNLYSFALMGYDKRLAQQSKRFRVPEGSFYLLGILFASLGIITGMHLCRHKTKHRAFQLFYILLLIQLYLVYRYLYPFYLP